MLKLTWRLARFAPNVNVLFKRPPSFMQMTLVIIHRDHKIIKNIAANVSHGEPQHPILVLTTLIALLVNRRGFICFDISFSYYPFN